MDFNLVAILPRRHPVLYHLGRNLHYDALNEGDPQRAGAGVKKKSEDRDKLFLLFLFFGTIVPLPKP